MEKKTKEKLIRIAITGPESTGKSWLAEHLAQYYHTRWVKEFSREYLAGIPRPYNYQDILKIAKGQYELENRVASGLLRDSILFVDTDFIVTKIWSLVKYGRCHRYIRSMVKSHKYNLYLLCGVDLPWEPDLLREHPQIREYLFGLYKSELETNGFPFVIITGTGDERLQHAVDAVDALLAASDVQD